MFLAGAFSRLARDHPSHAASLLSPNSFARRVPPRPYPIISPPVARGDTRTEKGARGDTRMEKGARGDTRAKEGAREEVERVGGQASACKRDGVGGEGEGRSATSARKRGGGAKEGGVR